MYSQTDSRWGDKKLGESGLKMSAFGCVVTAVAQALFNAGHKDYDPGNLLDRLNAVGGFTDKNHPQGAGLLIWKKVEEIEPAFHFGGKGVEFIEGLWGKFAHWVLVMNGQTYDPYYGKGDAPTGFVPVGRKQTASIDIVIKQEEPIPEPEAEKKVEVPADKEPGVHIVKEGDTLGQIIVDHYGPMLKAALWGRNGKVAEIAKWNDIKDPNLIFPGQEIILP